MFTSVNRRKRRAGIKTHVRRKIHGSAKRPRLAVFRTSKHFYMQVVDDSISSTICSASTLEKEFAGGKGHGGNVMAAKAVGELIAERLKEKGIEAVVFDRGGYLYHGRVRAAAEAAREKGLKF